MDGKFVRMLDILGIKSYITVLELSLLDAGCYLFLLNHLEMVAKFNHFYVKNRYF